MSNPFQRYALRSAQSGDDGSASAGGGGGGGAAGGAPAPARAAASSSTPSKRLKRSSSSSSPADEQQQQGDGASARPVALLPSPPPPLQQTVGMPEKLGDPARPLRMIIVGHNPSETTWQVGHAYAHRSNRMWPLLRSTGIAPPEHIKDAYDDDKMPALAGVGFSDVGTGHPGTESAAFASSVFVGWSQSFYDRMRRHVALASSAIGCTCGACGAPALIAFAGKRQFVELLNLNKKGSAKVKGVEVGLQDPVLIPDGWPFNPQHTEVWVCSSTSGASPMTNEQREAPWRALAQRLQQVPWPRTGIPRCQAVVAAAAAAAEPAGPD